jgi:hypothetical protein
VIRPNADVAGLGGFPADYRVLGTDDLGDVLAVDGKGKVWCFAHGTGDWSSRTSAFADEAQFRAFVEFQHELEPPRDEETIDELRDRLARIKEFLRGRRGVPYARSVCELRRRAAEGRDRGPAVLGIGARAGPRAAPGDRTALRPGSAQRWGRRRMDGARRSRTAKDALGVAGPFAEPWTQDAVVELLRPIAAGYELVCYKTG